MYGVLASGGMATVHFGRLLGLDGFSRTVAIKRLHPHLAKDPAFVAMFRDEARLAARIRHPNVVATLDIVAQDDELFLVMDYVHGESLSWLVRRLKEKSQRIPVSIACAAIVGALDGLHAAHEATDDLGHPLKIVHRDVSPHNIMVGLDGVPRLLDFGVAKAIGRAHSTQDGALKGKLAYMAPEQVRGLEVTRATDVYAAFVVLWELLTGEPLFSSQASAGILQKILVGTIDAPSARVPDLPEALNAIVLRGLAREPAERFATARQAAREIEKHVVVAPASAVGEWVESVFGAELGRRAQQISTLEHGPEASPTLVIEGTGLLDEVTTGIEPARARIGVTLPDSGPGEGTGTTAQGLRRPRAVVTAGALAVLATVAVVVMAIAFHHPDGASALPPGQLAARVASAALAGDSGPIEAPVVDAKRLVEQTPATTASQASPPPRPKLHPRAPGSASSPAKGGPGCRPPYTEAPDGTRQYKLECL